MCSLNDECALESTGGQKTHTDACACTSDFVAGCLHAVQEREMTNRPPHGLASLRPTTERSWVTSGKKREGKRKDKCSTD